MAMADREGEISLWVYVYLLCFMRLRKSFQRGVQLEGSGSLCSGRQTKGVVRIWSNFQATIPMGTIDGGVDMDCKISIKNQ